jgi:tRNA threonylcarbamoyladenosine biosynthesis protein TsaB
VNDVADSDWMLAVDASTPRCVAVLGRIGDGPRAALFEDATDDDDRQASARMHDRIAALLRHAAIEADALACIACGSGPGTFTGTRVAVALCKGLAEAIGKPVVAVSTLAAVAASIDREGKVLALLDARRGEVYAASFELRADDVVPLQLPQCVAIGDALRGAEGHRLVGPGVAPYADRIPAGIEHTAMTGPTARGLWRAALATHAREGTIDAARLDAIYLRESYAELGVNVAKRPTFHSPFLDPGRRSES